MKTLLLLRHAKSSWSDPDLDDHERPLSKRGKRDASRVGDLLVKRDLLPDLVLSSTAVRAKATAKKVARSSGYWGPIELDERLYHAEPEEIMEVVQELGDHLADPLMVVGHNPGLEELVESLTGISTPLPTAALVRLDLDLKHWGAWRRKTEVTHVRIFRPKKHAS